MFRPPEIKKSRGVRRLAGAFMYSIDGLAAAFRGEAAFRQEVAAGIPLLILALFLDVPAIEKCALAGSVFALWIVELLNSAVEECVNLASPGLHPLAKRAKDMASAAVFLALAFAALVWGVVLWGALAG